jgi:copper chaperone CopZ
MKSFKRIPTLLVLALGGLVITSTAFADLVKVSVNGMVCGFCAQGITKKLENTGLLEKINVDLEKKIVSFSTLPGKQFDDSSVTKLITEAGYTVVKIEREKP